MERISKYKIICLCGSTKYKEDFLKAQRDLTLEGYIVISLGIFSKADNEENIMTDEVKDMLHNMHRERIRLSDEIFVINKDGYIGDSTREEIEFAKENGKIIRYLE